MSDEFETFKRQAIHALIDMANAATMACGAIRKLGRSDTRPIIGESGPELFEPGKGGQAVRNFAYNITGLTPAEDIKRILADHDRQLLDGIAERLAEQKADGTVRRFDDVDAIREAAARKPPPPGLTVDENEGYLYNGVPFEPQISGIPISRFGGIPETPDGRRGALRKLRDELVGIHSFDCIFSDVIVTVTTKNGQLDGVRFTSRDKP